MHIFYFCPWPLSNPLTISTVLPNIAYLLNTLPSSHIHLFLPSFGHTVDISLYLPKPCISRLSLYSAEHSHQINPLNKLYSFLRTLLRIFIYSLRFKPVVSLCRGTSGFYGVSLLFLTRVPYVVESFEPHSKYMLQTGTWGQHSLKYFIQTLIEKLVRGSAFSLITVSYRYKQHLLSCKEVSTRYLYTLPCTADSKLFDFSDSVRSNVRAQHGITNQLVLIYVGKFGGIYYPPSILKGLRDIFSAYDKKIFLFILSPSSHEEIRLALTDAGIPSHQFYVNSVNHKEVNSYLCASDIAISFINSGPWSFACSPIKHAEYWSTGLPVIMPRGIGDESTFLESERLGAFADFYSPQDLLIAFNRCLSLSRKPHARSRIRDLGARHRDPYLLQTVYPDILRRL